MKSKLTPERQEKIIQAIRAGNYAKVAAAWAGIDESTFYNWMRRGLEELKRRAEGTEPDEEEGKFFQFFQSVLEADAAAEIEAVAVIRRAMPEDWRAAESYLQRRHRDRWGKQTLELTGDKPVIQIVTDSDGEDDHQPEADPAPDL